MRIHFHLVNLKVVRSIPIALEGCFVYKSNVYRQIVSHQVIVLTTNIVLNYENVKKDVSQTMIVNQERFATMMENVKNMLVEIQNSIVFRENTVWTMDARPPIFPSVSLVIIMIFLADIPEGVCAIVDVVEQANCEWDSAQQQPLSSCPENLKCLPSYFIGFQDGGGICAEAMHLKKCSDDIPCPRGFQCYDNVFRSSDPSNQNYDLLGVKFYVEEGYLP